jgi:hypothetical protein
MGTAVARFARAERRQDGAALAIMSLNRDRG